MTGAHLQHRTRPRAARGVAAVALAAAAVTGGCGLNIQAADLFLLSRSGPAGKLTLLVNDAGTIRCNGGRARPLPDPLLLRARDLATSLDGDAKANLRIPQAADSVYRYTIQLQAGTIAFPDTAARRHPALAQAELFALQAAQQACQLTG